MKNNFFFTQADKNDETEEQTIERKEQSTRRAKQKVADEEPSSLKTSVKEFTKIDKNTTFVIHEWIQSKCMSTIRARC